MGNKLSPINGIILEFCLPLHLLLLLAINIPMLSAHECDYFIPIRFAHETLVRIFSSVIRFIAGDRRIVCTSYASHFIEWVCFQPFVEHKKYKKMYMFEWHVSESMWRTNRHIDNEGFITRVCAQREIAVDSAVYLHFFAIDEVPHEWVFFLYFFTEYDFLWRRNWWWFPHIIFHPHRKKKTCIHFHFSVYWSRGRETETTGDGSREKKEIVFFPVKCSGVEFYLFLFQHRNDDDNI